MACECSDHPSATDYITSLWAADAADNDERRRLYGVDEYGNPLDHMDSHSICSTGYSPVCPTSLVSPESSVRSQRPSSRGFKDTHAPHPTKQPGIQLHRQLKPDERQDFEVSVQPSTIADDIWRHAGWQKDRQRVFDVLRRIATKGMVDRFANCGSAATVKYSPSTCEIRVSASFCRNRWCVPCAKARAREDEAKLRAIVIDEMDKGERVRLVTLTQRGYQGENLSTCLRRMKANWDGLRKSEWWRERVTGGCAVTEVKRGASGAWHVHRHLIVAGSYLDQHDLSDQWQQITEDSYRVYVESPRDAEDAVHYATKYASKPIPPEVYQDSDDLTEAIMALKGVRLFDYMGDWRKRDIEPAEPVRDWIKVASIHQLARRAAAGDAEAWSWLIIAAKHAADDLVSAADPAPPPLLDDYNWQACPSVPVMIDHVAINAAIWGQITAGRRRFLWEGVTLHL
jgi:hypothetical protein